MYEIKRNKIMILVLDLYVAVVKLTLLYNFWMWILEYDCKAFWTK